jgi:CRISPR type I-E-associated protein CasB/Cse2
MNRMSRENVEVDFDQLLKDLRAWGHNPRYVRRQWAEDYWQPEQSDIADSDSGHPDS